MSDDMENGGDVEHIAAIMSGLAKVLSANSIAAKLQNGREIVGPVMGFSLKRKEKKGEVSWSGSVRIQIDTGELAVDCQTIEKISSK